MGSNRVRDSTAAADPGELPPIADGPVEVEDLARLAGFDLLPREQKRSRLVFLPGEQLRELVRQRWRELLRRCGLSDRS